MQTKTLGLIVLCFTLGVVFRSFIDLGDTFALFVIMLGTSILLLSRFFLTVSHVGLGVSLCVLAIGVGILRVDFAFLDQSRSLLDNSVKQTVSLEGVVVSEPDERENTTRIIVETNVTELHETNTRIILTTPHYPSWEYGDIIVFEGVLEKPENFSSDQGRVFDYRGYLAVRGVHYEMYRPKITRVGEGAGNPIKRVLLDVKQAFLENVSQNLHEPYAALVGGLVLGAKQSLGEELLDKFRTTGLIHIVVLSGYNVTIIAYAIIRMFAFLPPVARAGLGVTSIGLFAIMTGAGATIVRASIMAALVVVGKALGREVDLLRLLAIAATLMIVHNPLIVVFDPSFQLSFIATLGLIMLPPLFERYLLWVPERFGLRDVAVATIATQLFVLPALVYMMGEISLVALFVNLLVLAVIPITMLFGFLTGLLGFIHPTLASIPAFFAFIFLYYEIAIVEVFSSLPFASVNVPPLSILFVLLWYGFYGFLIWWYAKYSRRPTSVAVD